MRLDTLRHRHGIQLEDDPMTPTSFALGTFASADAGPFAGLVLGDRVAELEPHLGSGVTVRALVDDWPQAFPRLQALANRLAPADGPHELGALRPLPPVQPSGQVFQAGANYRQHVLDLIAGAARRGDSSDGLTAADRDRAREELDERARDGRPFVFLGSAHAMVGARDDVVLPGDSQQHDWELELAAVIGRPARRVPRKRALDVIAGYTICNDLTTRDALIRPDARELGLDWLAGKNAPTFLPTGPLLVPAAHVGDPMDLRITLRVNGRTMQDETTADMLFDVAELIEHISNVAELRPGDLVLTGSPAGNGAHHGVFLQAGDVIEGEVSGLGTQRNRCVAEGARAEAPASKAEAAA
jgi:2-keto-4-pentenoate hydratase/2-oxohepta-3-ene-1,7-dioic acid hydratase in catechol pathway